MTVRRVGVGWRWAGRGWRLAVGRAGGGWRWAGTAAAARTSSHPWHDAATRTASAQRNERGRQRNVGLSSVPALCRPFKLSVPPCLETPCKYVKAPPPPPRINVSSFFPLFFFFHFMFPSPSIYSFIFFPRFLHVRVRACNFFPPLPPPHTFRPVIIAQLENDGNARRRLFSYFLLFRFIGKYTTPSGRLQTPRHVDVEFT